MTVNITQYELKNRLVYYPLTGIFRWTVKHGGIKYMSVAGAKCGKGYIFIRFNGRIYASHRLAWLYVYGKFPDNSIDHINHDQSDNRIANLRQVSHMENSHNRVINKNNTSGYPGVCWNKSASRWQVQIKVNYKAIYLGSFIEWWDAVCAKRSGEHKHGFHENHGARR